MLLHNFWEQFEKKPHVFILIVIEGEERRKIETHGRIEEKGGCWRQRADCIRV